MQTETSKPQVKMVDKTLAFITLLFASTLAMAAIASDDPFADFLDTIEGWAQGALGVGVSIAAVLFGAIRAVGNNNPMTALGGIALAAFIHWGPTVIRDIILGSGAII
jgi:conjugal transfer pilus assembly protein TraA